MPTDTLAGTLTDTPADSRPIPLNPACAQPMPTLAWTAALMAHEIRAPIAAVRALIELLDLHWNAHIPPGGLVLWNALQSEADRLYSLADSLLDLASAEYAKPMLGPVNLDALVATLVDQFNAEYPLALATVDPLGHIDADERLMVCLWRNLLGNAFKFTQRSPRPRIHVRVRELPGLREFSISDNGIGIPAEALEQVFQPFTRSQRSRAYDGHGLGLPAVRAIARAHGGDAHAVDCGHLGTELRFSVRHQADLLNPQ